MPAPTTSNDQRKHKALVIAVTPGAITQTSTTMYRVASQSHQGGAYQVYVNSRGQARCNCTDSARGNRCKHALAVEVLRSRQALCRRYRLAGEINDLLGSAVTIVRQCELGLRPEVEGLAAELVLLADKLNLAAGRVGVAA
jgi:hypothetical protein